MSLRDLAAEVGILVGSLYHHIVSKQELLLILMKDHLIDLHNSAERALEGVDGPVNRLRGFVRFHCEYHMLKRKEVYISNFELRNLEPKNYNLIVVLRRVHEKRLKDILDAGVSEGFFEISDTHVASFAILAMLTGICVWYRPS